MNKNLYIAKDIPDNQYKELLKECNKANLLPLLSENQESNKFVNLFNWLGTKLEITDNENNCIKKIYLQNYVINNYFYYFNNWYILVCPIPNTEILKLGIYCAFFILDGAICYTVHWIGIS
jgi:hypothetical protein